MTYCNLLEIGPLQMTKHHAMQYRYLHILMIVLVYLKDILNLATFVEV